MIRTSDVAMSNVEANLLARPDILHQIEIQATDTTR